MIRKTLLIPLVILMSLLVTTVVSAINDITIDGDLSDWHDENGYFVDAYSDTTPNRTDITQYGLAVVDNGASPQSLALMMVSDTFQNTGNATGDSHQLVFYVGSYEITVQMQNGCDAVNWVEIDGVITTAYTAVATSPINPPLNAPVDTTADCALEIEFPISTLPLLDSNGNNELLDESFHTNFATRQSGGVGNDNDQGDNGATPTAVALSSAGTGRSSLDQTLLIVATLLFAASAFVVQARTKQFIKIRS